MTIHEVMVTCDDTSHGELSIARFQRGYPEDPPMSWRLDQTVAMGHSKIPADGGLPEFIDANMRPGRQVTTVEEAERDGKVVSTTVQFVCPHCGRLSALRFDKCEVVFERIAAAGLDRISVARLRNRARVM